MGKSGNSTKGFEFKKFATPRIIGGIAIVLIVLWALTIMFGSSESPSSKRTAKTPHVSTAADNKSGAAHQTRSMDASHTTAGQSRSSETTHQGTTTHGKTTDHETASHDESAAVSKSASSNNTADSHGDSDSPKTASHDESAATRDKNMSHGAAATHEATTTHQAAADAGTTTTHGSDTHDTSSKAEHTVASQQHETQDQQPASTTSHEPQASGHAAEDQHTTEQDATTGHPMPSTVAGTSVHKPAPKGVAFVEAAIKPLSYELEERWWGWRPNDIIDVTDNVNNFQMGVLEVTRRTAVALAERISRTGTTAAFDENLEQAMNWLMVKPTSYWFPSAESKYRESLEELQAYLEKLNAGNAPFYTRTDNLIPLLASFEDLLGSCDENLVKQVNEDGTPVGFFSVDNYFYYTQGVASSMATILEAVHHDFLLILESRHGTELLHHAIISCQRAGEIDPWIILDSEMSSTFANHRANMAASISHARFYLGQLIKTLST